MDTLLGVHPIVPWDMKGEKSYPLNIQSPSSSHTERQDRCKRNP